MPGDLPEGLVGPSCSRAFYLCAGQRVLVHKGLDKLLRPDVPQPCLYREGEEELEEVMGRGVPTGEPGLVLLWAPCLTSRAPALLPGALQPCSGHHRAQCDLLTRQSSCPMPRGCQLTGNACGRWYPRKPGWKSGHWWPMPPGGGLVVQSWDQS